MMPASNGHVLAQLATDQATVDCPQNVRRLEHDRAGFHPACAAHRAVARVVMNLEQYGGKADEAPMPDTSPDRSQFGFPRREVIDKVAGQNLHEGMMRC